MEWFINQCDRLKYINIAGGLGVPIRDTDIPLDLDKWASIAARYINDDIALFVEPGDYIVKDAGVLLLQVAATEQKNGTTFVYLDGGVNLNPQPGLYQNQIPLGVVPIKQLLSQDGKQRITFAGNVNETLDLWAENVLMPPINTGDFIAILNNGGYGSSMASNHCVRYQFAEYIVN